MSFSADIFYDPYPIRQAGDAAPFKTHWLSPHQRNLASLQRKLADAANSTSDTDLARPSPIFTSQGEISLDALCIFFSQYRDALQQVHGLDLSEQNIANAYGLFSRRVETLQTRSDRVLVAGLAATAFARSGVSVHLIGDESFTGLVLNKLVPMLDYLEISFAVVKLGDSESERRRAYACDVVLLSARECAMDFLRDSVNWPKRGNRANRLVDGLIGRRAKNTLRIMNGLTCAIHLDAQSALIDNARAPIVLTQDAHPMHEVEELERALELAPSLGLASDYIFSGEGLEIAYTAQGKEKISAWAEQYGGIWGVPSAADLMIALALVALNILQKDLHYAVSKGQLKWLLPDDLVPGMKYYSKPFMTRVVELREGCSLTGLQEVVGRASYQHVFNRYIHLCGLAHATGYANGEFREIYRLSAESGRAKQRFDKTILLANDEQKLAYLSARLNMSDANAACTIYCVGVNQQGQELAHEIGQVGGISHTFTDSENMSHAIASQILQNGDRVLTDAQTLAGVASEIWRNTAQRFSLVVLNRSIDWYEDALVMQFAAADAGSITSREQVLSYQEEVLQNHSLPVLRRLQSVVPVFGRLGQSLFQVALEYRIARIQKQVAQESYNVRKNLLTHDEGMQSTLSFSGKGLYE